MRHRDIPLACPVVCYAAALDHTISSSKADNKVSHDEQQNVAMSRSQVSTLCVFVGTHTPTDEMKLFKRLLPLYIMYDILRLPVLILGFQDLKP